MFPVEQHTIFLTLAGSHAHGTARVGSDVDLRGVCVAPLPARLSLFSTFEQYRRPVARRACHLGDASSSALTQPPRAASTSRPNAWSSTSPSSSGSAPRPTPTPWRSSLRTSGTGCSRRPAWRQLHGERRRFLTRKVQQTFLGYAMAQLKKIKTHRSWLLNPPARKPSREDFGLPASGGTLSRDDQNRIEQSIADTNPQLRHRQRRHAQGHPDRGPGAHGRVRPRRAVGLGR